MRKVPQACPTIISSEIVMRKIAVDLIPLLPGAENGGAKLLATELVRILARVKPAWQFFLLTSQGSHDELSFLDGANVRRICAWGHKSGEKPLPPPSVATRMAQRLKPRLVRSLPFSLLSRLKRIYLRFGNESMPDSGILRELRPDLLFCPFTLPHFYRSKTPIVSIIYDLQFHYYPQFFDPQDAHLRSRNFQETCRLAARLVCISDYVRETVLQNSRLKPGRVIAVPIRLSNRLPHPSPQSISLLLRKFSLQADGFFLFPANFWPHKNHAMLFTAMGMLYSRHPDWAIQLVCTGAPDERMQNLRKAAMRMGLTNRILFPGFLAAEEFSALFVSCRALIFPSLYEGFGMPVLEAMNLGKPVLCSNVTSLPEVAGDAAIYFDPRKPDDILAAMEKLLKDPDIGKALVARGGTHVEGFNNPERMAQEYLRVFEEVFR
jgi:glycosyltransferase involved in cell wall biosynthesis